MSGHHPFDPAGYYAPRQAPQGLIRAAQALTVIGLLSLVIGLAMGEAYGVRTRAVFLINIVYFFGISMGGLVFAAAMTMTLARWGRPLKRIAESFVVFAPVLWVCLLVFLLTGGLELYEWHTHPETLHAHKAVWLTDGFFVVRLLGSTGLLILLGMLYLRTSLRPDLGAAAARLDGKHPSWWGRITAGWGDEQSEIDAAQKKMMNLSPPFAMLFAVIMSFFAFDAVMSLSPHWYANMFGGWFFCSCLWLAMTWTGIIALRCGKWLGIKPLLSGHIYHDLGKLVMAFSMVWAYMFYAQLLPIWYGNMTEEIGFLLVRMQLEPWTYLSRVVGAMCFLIPFGTLTSRGIKKLPLGFFMVLTVVAVGVWLERFLVTMPSVWFEESLPLGPIEIGVTAGFLGGFLWCVTKFLSSVPPVTVTDPYMQPHPDDVHITPKAAHGH